MAFVKAVNMKVMLKLYEGWLLLFLEDDGCIIIKNKHESD